MTPQEHYQCAEELLTEGAEVVGRIAACAAAREKAAKVICWPFLNGEVDRLTQRMDELGRKAMGIWAEAQVHATLATAPHWPERRLIQLADDQFAGEDVRPD